MWLVKTKTRLSSFLCCSFLSPFRVLFHHPLNVGPEHDRENLWAHFTTRNTTNDQWSYTHTRHTRTHLRQVCQSTYTTSNETNQPPHLLLEDESRQRSTRPLLPLFFLLLFFSQSLSFSPLFLSLPPHSTFPMCPPPQDLHQPERRSLSVRSSAST